MFQRLLNSISRKAYGRCIYCTYTYKYLSFMALLSSFSFFISDRGQNFFDYSFLLRFRVEKRIFFYFFRKKNQKKPKYPQRSQISLKWLFLFSIFKLFYGLKKFENKEQRLYFFKFDI